MIISLLVFFTLPLWVAAQNGASKSEPPVKALADRPCEKLPQTEKSIVRLSKIEVSPGRLEEYKSFAVEVGEISMRTEPGVIMMYAMAEKDNPCKVTILEIYADSAAYQSHIQSAHFKKYKTGTKEMVKSLELVDQTPLNLKMKAR